MQSETCLMPPTSHPLGDYMSWVKASGAAPETLRLRRYYLQRLADVYAPIPLTELTPLQLTDYLAYDRWSAETRKSARSAVRSYYRWALDMEIISRDPSRKLPPVRIPAGKPRPTPESIFEDALSGADRRERLMILLAGYAGLRRAEIARIHTDHISGGELRVNGKGGRVRIVPLHPRILNELRAVSPGYVFPGQISGHLSPGHVGVLIKRLLGPDWTTHTLRHRFATRAYAAERDLLAVQTLLGHSKPETTRRYTAIPDGALHAAVLAVG